MFDKIYGGIKNALDSELSSTKIGRKAGVTRQTVDSYRKNSSSIENMTLSIAEKLYNLNFKMGVIEMNLIEVTDVYGRKKTVNHAESKVYDYSNKKNEITYNGPIYENGKPIGFYTNYILPGKIDDIETKMNTWNNRVSGFYAQEVGFKSTENDPDNEIWDKYVEMVENNQEEYFDEHGDWKQDLVIDPRNLTRESFF